MGLVTAPQIALRNIRRWCRLSSGYRITLWKAPGRWPIDNYFDHSWKMTLFRECKNKRILITQTQVYEDHWYECYDTKIWLNPTQWKCNCRILDNTRFDVFHLIKWIQMHRFCRWIRTPRPTITPHIKRIHSTFLLTCNFLIICGLRQRRSPLWVSVYGGEGIGVKGHHCTASSDILFPGNAFVHPGEIQTIKPFANTFPKQHT